MKYKIKPLVWKQDKTFKAVCIAYVLNGFKYEIKDYIEYPQNHIAAYYLSQDGYGNDVYRGSSISEAKAVATAHWYSLLEDVLEEVE